MKISAFKLLYLGSLCVAKLYAKNALNVSLSMGRNPVNSRKELLILMFIILLSTYNWEVLMSVRNCSIHRSGLK